MSKRLFLLVLALVIVVIAGAVGGAIGGVMAGKDKKTSNHPASGNGSTSTAANATSTPVSREVSMQTTSRSDVSIETASVTGTSGNLAAFATPTNIATMLDISKSIGSLVASANIAYRVYPGSGYFTLPQSLPFSMAPKPGTPLSTVEVSSSENTTVSLFYLDASNNIILATYISALSGLDLTLRNTFIIVPSTGVHPNTQLAAIYLSSAFGYRLYYQSPSSVLQELAIDNTGWHNGEVLPVAAIAGSPLSVTITKVESPTPRLVVFYVDDKTRTLFSVTYYIEWKQGVALSTTALYAWTTNTALASITQTNSVYIRAYYIGSDKEIYEMLDPGAGTV
ncbi:uncharacterized protein RAG0_15946 [Rhynchosporium agropyri]|uniref:Uncharacterized protein n=1 Tax=Rhynchosporium agropyri TaxID=914238 RepID=A0A1E1LN56_9HELO|nr:uncharacterized protein RAG0_15946 [Rhynchosporium agropyri]